MNFPPIDWNEYNQPPFLPQWLCKDETLEMARYDDGLREDIDNNIRAMVEQYDIDKVKDTLLDRIGKILAEPRDANDDDLYRTLLKLRILLNTTSGSVNDVIKVIKFIYSSEIVHITPDYPAGLTILHDGEGQNLNFNKIIAAVVPAGVAYNTKELFYFFEEILMAEVAKVNINYNAVEAISGQIYHNGRILRDGHTDRGIERKPFFHNGKVKRNGTATHKPYYYTNAISIITTPFRHSSGIRDPLTIILKIGNYDDRFLGRLLHNGAVKRDGSVKHNGISDTSASDIMSHFMVSMRINETLPSTESSKIMVIKNMSDSMLKDLRHNGKIIRNGTAYHTGKVIDIMRLHYLVTGFEDTATGILYHNGSIKRDGSETHKSTGNRLAYETLSIATHVNISEIMPSAELSKIIVHDYMSDIFEKDQRHDGHIIRNGTAYRNRKPVEKIQLHYKLEGFEDICAGLLYHNGSIKRDGSETHNRTGNLPVYERFSAGIRKHHFHNGVYRRNGEIKHDGMVLIPLE